MYRISAIGIKDKDLLVLRSLLQLVGKTIHIECTYVDEPAHAQVVFVGKMPSPQVAALVAHYADRKTLVYCQSSGEDAPPGVRCLAHCPPRLSELAALLNELLAKAATAAVAPATAALPVFDSEDCLAGAIQLRIPKLLIDHPLVVHAPDAPPLLIDAHSGVRTVHAEPMWFESTEPWRVPVADCRLEVAISQKHLVSLRQQAARPFLGMRFWGIMSASRGRLSSRLSESAMFGLRKRPDFRNWPHHPWQLALAELMLDQPAPLRAWAAATGQKTAKVVDFVNAAAALGLLLEKRC